MTNIPRCPTWIGDTNSAPHLDGFAFPAPLGFDEAGRIWFAVNFLLVLVDYPSLANPVPDFAGRSASGVSTIRSDGVLYRPQLEQAGSLVRVYKVAVDGSSTLITSEPGGSGTGYNLTYHHTTGEIFGSRSGSLGPGQGIYVLNEPDQKFDSIYPMSINPIGNAPVTTENYLWFSVADHFPGDGWSDFRIGRLNVHTRVVETSEIILDNIQTSPVLVPGPDDTILAFEFLKEAWYIDNSMQVVSSNCTQLSGYPFGGASCTSNLTFDSACLAFGEIIDDELIRSFWQYPGAMPPTLGFIQKFQSSTSSLSLTAGSKSEYGDEDGPALNARFTSTKDISYTWDNVQRKPYTAGNRYYFLDGNKVKLLHPCEDDIEVIS